MDFISLQCAQLPHTWCHGFPAMMGYSFKLGLEISFLAEAALSCILSEQQEG